MIQAVEFEQPKTPRADPLENTDLARRLRRMEWPTAAPEVKQRCYDAILARIGMDGDEREGAAGGSGK
jgi:hypothetical protein